MSYVPQFRDAERSQSKACILLTGTTGKGKSGLGLLLAYFLAKKEWQKLYAIDTEKRSLDLFQDVKAHTGDVVYGRFKKLDLTAADGYRPSHYLASINYAIAAGADAMFVDSISHMWLQKGGMLQLKEETIRKSGGALNNWTAWGTEEMIAEKNCILECIRNEDIHLISTGRMKMKRTLVDGKMVELGMELQQMPDLEFEFDLVLDMVSPGNSDGTPPRAKVTKTRYDIFTKDVVYDFTDELMGQIVEYLNTGVDIAELHERQRLERIAGLKLFLDSNASAAAIYPSIKEQLGFKDTPLDELKLAQVRELSQVMMS